MSISNLRVYLLKRFIINNGFVEFWNGVRFMSISIVFSNAALDLT